jgi:hypothetical protein
MQKAEKLGEFWWEGLDELSGKLRRRMGSEILANEKGY